MLAPILLRIQTLSLRLALRRSPGCAGGAARASRFSLHLKAHIQQATCALNLQHDCVPGLQGADGGAERIHGIDGRGIELVDYIACLEAGVGQDQVGGASNHDDT